MPTLSESLGLETSPNNAKKEYGLATSILAGVGSGVFKIFEGAATLGATLLDLGVDKDRAEAVEAFFDDINPFDEAAEARSGYSWAFHACSSGSSPPTPTSRNDKIPE